MRNVDENDDTEIVHKPSSDYYINEEQKPIPAKMICSVDDIINVVKELNEEDNIVHLIQIDDDLVKILYELIEARYIPKITFEASRITRIICKFQREDNQKDIF